MKRPNVSRRSFMKMAAATVAATGIVAGGSGALAVAAPMDDETNVTRVRSCCRACGKMECGVWAIVKNGRAIRVEGDESAFQSMGNCCTKSQASIQATYHPDRLYYPMKRTNPKGDDDPGWVRISWDEALKTLVDKIKETQKQYGNLALFAMSGTSRLWGMIAYGAFSQLTGSPNIAIPWQVCKGPRHYGTAIQSVFQYSWQETVGRPAVLTYWGTGPEMSNYDDSCRTVVDAQEKVDQYIIVDPRLTNLGKEADQWLHLRPGTDAAMALAWTNVIIENKLYDELFVKKWTNAPYLVKPGKAVKAGYGYATMDGTFDVVTRLLTQADIEEGGDPMKFMVWDNLNGKLTFCDAETCTWEGQTWAPPTKGKPAQQQHLVPGVSQGFVPDPTGFGVEDGFETPIDPAIYGEFDVTLKDGSTIKVKPVWEHYRERCADYTPEKAAVITGVPAEKIEKAAKTYGTRLYPETGYGNGGILYQLALEHSANSINCVRAIDALIGITGNW
ncbi:MAG: molybdopterin-dependent oxidoreductase, partial [Eggerthellaceae bacterium]|nr:molybdopterin-dependent oxidoreductase [Eggerthellaceae bacterium]